MKHKLKDIFDLQMGKTPSRNKTEYWIARDYKWISIADLTKTTKYISETKEYLSESAVEESGIKIIPANTVVMSFKLSIGKVAITSEDMYSNEAIMAFHDKHIVEILPEYIFYMFKYKNWDEGSNKAVMGKTLNKASLSEIEVNICPIEKQKKIIQVLDKLADIISGREQELKLLDELIKARFVEMFGNPVTNTYELPIAILSELGALGRGISKHRPRNDPKLLGGEYPLVQTGDVANAGLYITSYNSTYSELGLRQSKLWKKGTLCITIAANIAKTSILEFDACFPDSIVGFIANEKTNNIFIHYWFSFFQSILESQAPESAQKNINLKILSELKVIMPKKEKQDDFIVFINQVNKSKVAVQKALDEAQTLFDSLMQEYFG